MNNFALNIREFGAQPGEDDSAAAANDRAFIEALAALRKTGGRLYIPSGKYRLGKPIVLRQMRNVVLFGDGGNAAHPGTHLIYRGEDPAGGLHLQTCIHGRFEDICFTGDGGTPETVVRIDAVEDGPSAVSSLNNVFRGCSFRTSSAARSDVRGVSLQDAGHTEFLHCWFQVAEVAARIGGPMRTPRPTISNGQCSNTVFDNCLFFGDVIGERGTNVSFQNCEFATKQNGDGAKIDFGVGTNPHVCNVTIRDCFALNGKTNRGAFFTQGTNGLGLVMTNSRIRGYAIGVDLDGGGAAMLAANVFEQTSPGAVDIRIHCAEELVSMAANQHQKTLEAGNRKVIFAGRSH